MSWLSKTIKKAKKSLKKITIKNVAGKVSGALKKLSNIPVIGSTLNTVTGGLVNVAATGLGKIQKQINKAKSTTSVKVLGGLGNVIKDKANSGSNLPSKVSVSTLNNASSMFGDHPKRSFWAFLGKTKKIRSN